MQSSKKYNSATQMSKFIKPIYNTIAIPETEEVDHSVPQSAHKIVEANSGRLNQARINKNIHS